MLMRYSTEMRLSKKTMGCSRDMVRSSRLSMIILMTLGKWSIGKTAFGNG